MVYAHLHLHTPEKPFRDTITAAIESFTVLITDLKNGTFTHADGVTALSSLLDKHTMIHNQTPS